MATESHGITRDATPAQILRDCASSFEELLAGKNLRGVLTQKDLRNAAAWCEQRAMRWEAAPPYKASFNAPPATMTAQARGHLGGRKQASVAHTCTCGRRIFGNGGFASHRKHCPEYISEVSPGA
jgi:hypothetical protein